MSVSLDRRGATEQRITDTKHSPWLTASDRKQGSTCKQGDWPLATDTGASVSIMVLLLHLQNSCRGIAAFSLCPKGELHDCSVSLT